MENKKYKMKNGHGYIISEIAEMLEVSSTAIGHYVRKGILKTKKTKGNHIISKSDLEVFLLDRDKRLKQRVYKLGQKIVLTQKALETITKTKGV